MSQLHPSHLPDFLRFVSGQHKDALRAALPVGFSECSEGTQASIRYNPLELMAILDGLDAAAEYIDSTLPKVKRETLEEGSPVVAHAVYS